MRQYNQWELIGRENFNEVAYINLLDKALILSIVNSPNFKDLFVNKGITNVIMKNNCLFFYGYWYNIH